MAETQEDCWSCNGSGKRMALYRECIHDPRFLTGNCWRFEVRQIVKKCPACGGTGKQKERDDGADTS